ncbi:zinc-dependent metalloprotease [Prevotella sp. KH2C16]|uniref:zinc-dependent metalloprotease n=1 Tax=Prevotella sp. KH2C16 TaxID=1855325 RepID=UPI0008E4A83A|nr:zinc-dependent metalloprotease [Prevotella sp. KH2C16]SFG50361.1 protein of unknown function [Prevotella sp. KH2C16]
MSFGHTANLHHFLYEHGGEKVCDGILPTYRVHGKLYWQVADSLVGREFSLFTTLLTTPASPHRNIDKTYGYSGDMLGPVFLSIQRHGNELWIGDPQHHRVWHDARSSDAEIAALTTNFRLYHRLPIVARGDGNVLVEVESMLRKSPLFGLDLFSFDLSLNGRISACDAIGAVKGYPDRLLMRIDRSYHTSRPMPPYQGEPYVGRYETGLCLSLLPREGMPVRQLDRVGYFTLAQELYEDKHPGHRRVIAKKWNLEISPADRGRYFRGELVRPVRPIVFYIDRNTPAHYVPYIIAGVRAWLPAFEQAGFKDAIDARLAPTPDEDPNFCIYDTHYPFISWKVSARSNAYGPSPCMSQSAEIATCHIGIFSSVNNISQQWNFTQLGAYDSTAWRISLPQDVCGDLMQFVITHEVGHSLGLEHNYLGSAHMSLEEATDTAFLARYGISSSIMDYVRFNYALRHGDSVQFAHRRVQLGDYDRFAIEWGYRIFPGRTEKVRLRQRAKWCRRQLQNPRLRYLTINPGLYNKAEDLGDDHVAFNTRGMENLQYICAQASRWRVDDAVGKSVMQQRYRSMLSHYTWWMQQVMDHLNDKYPAADGKSGFAAESIDYNRRVMHFIRQYLLEAPTWLFASDVTRNINIDADQEFTNTVLPLIQQLVGAIPQVLQNEQSGTTAIAASEVVDSIHTSLFAPWQRDGMESKEQFMLQRWYVEALHDNLDRTLKQGQSHVALLFMRALQRITNEVTQAAGHTADQLAQRRAAELIRLTQISL